MGYYRVPVGKIGIVTRLHGPRHRGEISRHVSVLGSPGPQAKILKSGQEGFLTPGLFSVKYVDQVHVKRGTIGLVDAREGYARQDALAPFVECGHFQDGGAFLAGGGQRGLQMQVLPEGHYDINPHIFNVITTENVDQYSDLGLKRSDLYATAINAGETGVVVTHLGVPKTTNSTTAAPRVPGRHYFRDPWRFLAGGGQLGVQEETLPSGGRYLINPVFAHVVRVPIREIELEWTKDPKTEANFDASLEQVDLDVEGHKVRLELTQTLRIPERAAPGLVLRFGDEHARNGGHPVQQFVGKVLANTVTAHFQKISAHEKIRDFIIKYDQIGTALTQELDDAISASGAVPVKTQLGAYTVEPDDINKLRQDIAHKKHEINLREADLEAQRVQNQINKERLEIEAEREKLKLLLTQGEVDMFGPEAVLYLRLVKEMTQMQVPGTIVGGDIAEAMRSLHFSQVSELLKNIGGASDERRRLEAPPGSEEDPDDDAESGLPDPLQAPVQPATMTTITTRPRSGRC